MNLLIGYATSKSLVSRLVVFALVLVSASMVVTPSVSAIGVTQRNRTQSCVILGGNLRGTTIYHEYQTRRGGQWYVNSISASATPKYVQSLWGPDATWRIKDYYKTGPALAGHYGVTYRFQASRALTAPQFLSCTTY